MMILDCVQCVCCNLLGVFLIPVPISLQQKALVKGVSFVRVVVKGLGPGRMVSLLTAWFPLHA